jgi:type II secretion system protein H
MTSRAESGGFTLTEMLVVLAILALVSATALHFDWSGSLANERLRSAAQQLASDLRRARSQAIADGVTAGISFDVAGRRYIRWPSRLEQSIPSGIAVRVSTGADAREQPSGIVDVLFDAGGDAPGATFTLTQNGQSQRVADAARRYLAAVAPVFRPDGHRDRVFR